VSVDDWNMLLAAQRINQTIALKLTHTIFKLKINQASCLCYLLITNDDLPISILPFQSTNKWNISEHVMCLSD